LLELVDLLSVVFDFAAVDFLAEFHEPYLYFLLLAVVYELQLFAKFLLVARELVVGCRCSLIQRLDELVEVDVLVVLVVELSKSSSAFTTSSLAISTSALPCLGLQLDASSPQR
jgi:hypothetical protein